MPGLVRVTPVPHATAKRVITAKHYSRNAGTVLRAYGIDVDGALHGVCTYGQPSPPNYKHAFKPRDFALYELTRLVVESSCPNAASILISGSLRLLPQPCAVLSYADSAVGHAGIVYQATNWLYCGSTVSHDKLYLIDGVWRHPLFLKSRGITDPSRWAKENGVEMKKPEHKHRYVYLCGSRKDKKRMLACLSWPVVTPYPKAERSCYDDGPPLTSVVP